MTARALPVPRWQTPLPATVTGSWGPEVADWSRRELGIVLDRWQQRALNRALAVDVDDRLVHRTYLVSTGRQNGKTVTVRALVGWALTAAETPDWERMLGLAHDRKQARLIYEPVLEDLAPIRRRWPRAGLALTRYLGIRSNLYGRHRTYDVGSKESRNAIRGSTNDLALFDELRTQVNYDTWNALEPTTTARPDPLIVGLSTMGDDRSVLLRDWFDRTLRIIDGSEPFSGFGATIYAADDDDDPADPRAWRKANPALAEGRLDPRAIAASRYTLTPAGFRQERLNLWAEGADDSPIPMAAWRRQIGRQPDGAVRVVLGAEATPSWRRVTVTVALVTDAGAWVAAAGELDADRTAGASTIAPRELVDLVERMARAWHPSALAFSKSAAAAPHLEAWATSSRSRLGYQVAPVAMTPRHIRSASALFRTELLGGRLTHLDDPLLAQQVRVVRATGSIASDDWYLSIRDSQGEVDAIRAAAWAAWHAIAPEEFDPGSQIFL